jgi:predicted TIM-barrel fold metal-dependent hydrolase
MDLAIIDGHCHIFPPLAGPCGFPDAETHLTYIQRAMHMHGNQPYRRRRDHARIAERVLWDANDPSPAGRATDVAFRVGRCGRFEWETAGEPTYVQFLPPHMADLSASPEVIVTSMDYAGITTSILQNDHIYGNLADDFAAAGRAHPGRFIGLAQVDEANAYREGQLQILRDQVERLGMAGLYFTTAGLSVSGYTPLHDQPAYDPLWAEVARLDLPVFWVQFGSSPVGSYEDEMRCLERIVERHPTIRHVLVHGLPTALYADPQDRVTLPEVIHRLMRSGQVYPELLYPISWGGRHDYPYAKAAVQFRQIFDAFGPDRFIWGSDMPNVERFCTYRQSLTYALDHFNFLGDDGRRLIFRENALRLFSRDPILR